MTRETTEQRGKRIAGELRAATADAAGVLKDMRAVIREVRELLPVAARMAVASELLPHLEAMQQRIMQGITAAETEISNRFNETSEGLEALMNDFVARGNLYKLGMPVVEGVKAVEEIIENAKRATRK